MRSKFLSNYPETLFNNPKLPLIASFFGEYAIIDPFGIVYAHQIQIVEKSEHLAIVNASYFKGNYTLIEAEYDSTIIYIEHTSSIDPGTEIHIAIAP